MAERRPRVAIIGLGPRGTYALERLRAHAAAADLAVAVDAFEPAATPGAGPHYEPTQPSCLRMNLPAGSVDMWPPAGRPPEASDFASWMSARGTPVGADDYPPRGCVGEYLAAGLATILERPHSLSVRLVRRRVTSIARSDGRWRVGAADVSGDYDEVLLATGHAPAQPPAALVRQAGTVGPPYPAERHLAPGRIPPGAVVAVRGFALTFIDCALAMSEGRGGAFAPVGNGPFMRYRPGGHEPAAILPFSRSGRCMHAKPVAALTEGRADLADVAAAGRERIARLPAGLSVADGILPALADAATRSLAAMGAHGGEAARCERMLADMLAGAPPQGQDDPRRELETSIATGSGLGAVDAPWALGHVWRALYPAIVERLGGDGMDGEQWAGFRRLAAEMERLAFGPGLGNAARLLALIDHGLVRLDHVAGAAIVSRPEGTTAIESRAGARSVDVVVDAVLAPPGVAPGDRLTAALIEAGHARVAPGRRGIDVDPAGRCRGRLGFVTPGLAAIGRVTEDVIVGNDTLSRTLHRTPDLWAAALIATHAPRGRRGNATPVLAP